MIVSWLSLYRQYWNDYEFHSSLNCFVSSFGIAVISWRIGMVGPFLAFAICIPSSYIYGICSGQKPIQSIFKLNGTSTSLLFHLQESPVALFFCYTLVFSFFHFSEFLVTAISNRRSLQPDSFLLNHSMAYWIAAFASWTEFFIEVYFTPFLKVGVVGGFGLILCICGEIIRKLAMLHAGNGFTHRLARSKRPDHRLVTTGIYSFLRHPGYSGWFIWSIGTQIILCNPICLFAYIYISWNFFNERIYEEERDLINFFGQQYTNYRQNVWVGVPFVKGFEP
ncbi:isoprenylcysteine carboxyl methyltransferase family protein [Dictyocaulus viviparus]|uniref:Protein-S-isoprenylcysteine O-methyltransferase n=1 Tax=Dictyocaulus viviparus TaxID=29172 RepID=A0A0D8XDT9_DICVI|nr:isoprenylcysteine carboxyl methyltransferase family protein [Dictyocaulus viviparus]